MAATIKDQNTHYLQSLNALDSLKKGTILKRIASLKQQIFPLTNPTTDAQGNSIQLWSVPEAKIVGTIKKPNGSIRFITSDKIRNGLNAEDNIESLHQRLMTATNGDWDFTLIDNCILTIWPHLSASGWHDAIPKSKENCRGIIRLARGRSQEQMCAWFYSNGYEVSQPGKNRPQAEIEIHMGDSFIGKLNASNSKGIRDLLKQGGYIKAVHFEPPNPHEKGGDFVGRGISFIHPKDRTQTKFNIDYTKVDFKIIPGGRAENEGGYHIDIRSSRFEGKVKVSTQETYQTNHSVRKEGNEPYYKLKPDDLKGQQKPHHNRSFNTPAMKAFQQRVQQTHLTESYNSIHRHNPILPNASLAGSIGGVACSSAYIEGLFDLPDALFEDHHIFCVEGLKDGKIPFSNEALSQILRELAIGIYVHSAMPFFSLHFNENADLYPVIHPFYRNTLVGQVISMLDYIMKGYLSGGVYSKEFINEWQENPNWQEKNKQALRELVDFHKY